MHPLQFERRRLPPLNAVRAFEAAARHATFQAAGEELGVTPGAVAQQVKILEDWLGQPLFRRLPSRGVVLTQAGERYAAATRLLLDGLAEATARLRREDQAHVLTVTTIPSLAARWLIPRLGEFRRRHPDLDVRTLASTGLTDFSREAVDIGLRLGRTGRYPGLRSDLLLTETFFPVCSPALVEGGPHPLREPSDLRHHTLLHEEIEPGIPDYVDWPRWLATAGVTGVDATRGPRFTHTFLALHAAEAGQGVALATSVLIGDDLRSGRLVRPFALEIPGPYNYYVVYPDELADLPKVVAFRTWLKEAAATFAP